MARVLLGVTGSVAAIRVPALCEVLCAGGHEVRIAATEHAFYFFDPADLDAPSWVPGGALVEDGRGSGESPAARVTVHRDRDEWPAAPYRRGDEVLHIALRSWADVLVVAPLDANTLAKFALGLSDNLLTCVFRAWDFAKPVVLAPAMNTLMWSSPVTQRHLRMLLDDRGDGRAPLDWPLDAADLVFARHAPRIILVPPQAKRLACGDFGLGAMAEPAAIAEAVLAWSEFKEGEA